MTRRYFAFSVMETKKENSEKYLPGCSFFHRRNVLHLSPSEFLSITRLGLLLRMRKNGRYIMASVSVVTGRILASVSGVTGRILALGFASG